MRPRNSALITVLLVGVLCGCGRHLIRPDFIPSSYRFQRLAIVPFRTTVGAAGIGGYELLPADEERLFRTLLEEAAARAFASSGIQVIAVDAERSPPNMTSRHFEDLFFELGLERQKAVTDVAIGYRNEFRYRCSGRVPELAAELGVDGFIFADFEGIRRTRGEYALAFFRSLLMAIANMDIFTRFPGRSFVSGDVQIIDGPSSELLFFNSVDTKEADFTNREEVGDLLDDLFAPFTDRLGFS